MENDGAQLHDCHFRIPNVSERSGGGGVWKRAKLTQFDSLARVFMKNAPRFILLGAVPSSQWTTQLTELITWRR